MHRNHSHATPQYGKAFAIGLFLNTLFVVIEAGYGAWANSLALLADAGHNLSDVFGLLMAWAGYALSRIPPTSRRTYGWRGTTILAALFNAMILLVAVGAIAWEAIERFFAPPAVTGVAVLIVAGIGFVINLATALLFMRGRDKDLNIQGAFLHMAADAAVSIGVVIAGGVILLTGWHWIDPFTSLVIAAVILLSTWGLFKESFNLAVQSVPQGIDPEQVERYLSRLPRVLEVHDLHIWAMSTTETALTVHLVTPEPSNKDDRLLVTAGKELHDRFEIVHVTIQIEHATTEESCPQSSPEML
jgi:cobalt-zinc-cadmium efflux system protein